MKIIFPFQTIAVHAKNRNGFTNFFVKTWGDSKMQIRQRLEGANVVPLAMALIHLTGDIAVLDEIAPYVRGAWDHLESVPPELAASLRDRMADALERHNAGAQPALAEPPVDLVKRMMSVAVADTVEARYVPMLIEHMGLSVSGMTEHARPALLNPQKEHQKLSAIIVGAGASGICAAISLKKAGIDYQIIEKSADVGGTWNENRYPGCAVDTPNHFYQFSFEPNNLWPNYFSRRESIHEYLRQCTRKYGLQEHIQFNTEVQEAAYDEDHGLWSVTCRKADGTTSTHTANFLICAVGQLSRPSIPAFPGMDKFQGQIIHTAQWPEGLDLTGKRVALVGTGASAIQVGPSIADQVSKLYVIQRSGSWISRRPNIDGVVSENKKWALENVPFYAAWYRFQLFWAFGDGLFEALKIDPQWDGGDESINPVNAQIRQKMIAYMRRELAGREDLLEKVIPNFPPFGKRVLGDPGWFKMLTKDNVELISSAIQSLGPHEIIFKDASSIEVDTIICATGFKATQMLWPMKIKGRGGVLLEDRWGQNDARAYLGITVPQFPNMFILFGPNTNLGHGGSAIFLAECQVHHIMRLLDHMVSSGAESIECSEAAHDAYNDLIDSKLRTLSWSHPSVDTWYKNQNGRIVTNQPWKLIEYWELTRNFRPEDYLTQNRQPAD